MDSGTTIRFIDYTDGDGSITQAVNFMDFTKSNNRHNRCSKRPQLPLRFIWWAEAQQASTISNRLSQFSQLSALFEVIDKPPICWRDKTNSFAMFNDKRIAQRKF